MKYLPTNRNVICKAHCFNLAASGKIACGNIDGLNDQSCCFQNDNKGFDESRVYERNNLIWYKLKESCIGNGCWTEQNKCYSDLKEVDAKDEMTCKFICLESKGCRVASFADNVCKIQATRALAVGGSCKTFRVSFACKKESSWNRYHDKSYPGLFNAGLMEASACRVKCQITNECTVYEMNGGICYYQKELKTAEECTIRDNVGAVTYIMKEHLQFTSI